jgi:hypothetical protein
MRKKASRLVGPDEHVRLSGVADEFLARRVGVGRREEPPRYESGFRAHGSNQQFHRLLRHAVARALTTAPSLAGVSPAAADILIRHRWRRKGRPGRCRISRRRWRFLQRGRPAPWRPLGGTQNRRWRRAGRWTDRQRTAVVSDLCDSVPGGPPPPMRHEKCCGSLQDSHRRTRQPIRRGPICRCRENAALNFASSTAPSASLRDRAAPVRRAPHGRRRAVPDPRGLRSAAAGELVAALSRTDS